ncbi:DUF5362 domain-containing protein [Zooshikella marina]|uniref:DUF5362 domain-containing protein n=1 Tax=Zooshikella ganghwensis TaxID=202772 RepID=A0A4P9VIH4_9GAMM|nr:DUF5362 domain-containing protein [Zooshikella ganghwensis]MBU2706367.1 DUF5362 domain-containing protein [Zooshikella ganghwensis]RDH42164.1 hypothetical protein B9G39_01175 [Zooshikella ganghwensis]
MDNEKALVGEMTLPIFQCKGWLKLIGILSIVGGVVTALSIVGIVIAWLPIWQGVLLYQSASAIEEAKHNESKEALLKSLNKIKVYFIIMGVLMLIWLIFVALAVVFGGLGIFMNMAQMQGM